MCWRYYPAPLPARLHMLWRESHTPCSRTMLSRSRGVRFKQNRGFAKNDQHFPSHSFRSGKLSQPGLPEDDRRARPLLSEEIGASPPATDPQGVHELPAIAGRAGVTPVDRSDVRAGTISGATGQAVTVGSLRLSLCGCVRSRCLPDCLAGFRGFRDPRLESPNLAVGSGLPLLGSPWLAPESLMRG